jgi:hypothetical protein
MKQPQTQAEAKPARTEQLMMMNRLFGPRGFLTEEEQQIGQQIQERLRPQFDANLGNNRPFPQNVRQQLAFGTVDDALQQQQLNSGIGAIR